MPVTVNWDNDEHNVLHYRMTGNWTWEEYFAALKEGRECMKSVPHSVSIINNMLDTHHVPHSFITTARSVIDKRPPNTGLAIFISKSMFFGMLYNVFAKVSPIIRENYLLTNSVEDARTLIKEWQTKRQLETL
jgi:hypothetical protein